MQVENIFSEWYKQRFNSIVDQPPSEVWNNISNELDIMEVWNKVDSRLNSIERRRTFVRRSAYASILLLLLFTFGIAVFHADKTSENKILLAENGNDHNDAVLSSLSDAGPSIRVEKISPKSSGSHGEATVYSKLPSKNTLSIAFSSEGKGTNSERYKQKLTATVSQKKADTLLANPSVEEDNERVSVVQEILVEPIPNTLISSGAQDFLTVKQNIIPSNSDSDYYSRSEGENKFYGFYFGGTFSGDNIWLINQLTLDGLKSNSLNDTKIGFGYSYGISAGYNFNKHFGGEANWYVNSLLGQTYHLYDEGQYISRSISMDVSIINLIMKYRNQSFNSWLNTSSSHNVLLGMNLQVFKKDRSRTPPADSDDDVDVYENMSAHFANTSYGVIVGYEYELLAFKKIILSSAIVGNYGLTNMFEGNQYVPESFNRTHAASICLNFGAKYIIK